MRPINISTVIGCAISETEQIPMIKKAGFDGFFTMFTGTEPIDLWAKEARKHNLEFETIHGSFQYANRLWESDSSAEEYLAYLQSIIDSCHQISVDKCILHVTVGNTAPPISPEGLLRFQKLCDYAKSQNVHICFENLEPLPHLEAVMDFVKDPFHGFCWDIGHNACYTPNLDLMKKYGSRLKCLHIHDNLGVTRPGDIDYRDDRHFLPFDGILDWDWFVGQLSKYHYEGPITLEVSNQGLPKYQTMSLEEYLKEAYNRGVKLRDKLNQI